jgi:hypothetical protein
MDANISAATASFISGGCVFTTGNYVCISHSFDTSGASSASVYTNSLSNRWIAKKDWVTTAYVAGTAITLDKWHMIFTGNIAVCTAATIVTAN